MQAFVNVISSRGSISETCWYVLDDRIPADSIKVRLLTVLTSFAATYVISDMYSANLTSLLARPGRGKSYMTYPVRYRVYPVPNYNLPALAVSISSPLVPPHRERRDSFFPRCALIRRLHETSNVDWWDAKVVAVYASLPMRLSNPSLPAPA